MTTTDKMDKKGIRVAIAVAFALIVDLHHVNLGFLPLPAEDDLKHMRHVVHEIDRIVPANDEVARFEVGARIGFLVPADGGPDFRCCRGGHGGKIKRPVTPVEGGSDGAPASKYGVMGNKPQRAVPEAGAPSGA